MPKKEKVLLRENCAQISNRLFIKYVTVAVYVYADLVREMI